MTVYVLFMKLNGGADKFLRLFQSESSAKHYAAGYSKHPIKWEGLQGEARYRYFYIKEVEVVA